MAKFQLTSLLKPVQKRIAELEGERDGIDAELEKLRRVVTDLGGSSNGRAAKPGKTGGKKGGKRKRSSPEELQERATAIIKFIKGAGKEGAAASDILKRYPVTGSVKAFLKKWGGDAKVTAKGSRKLTRYHAD